MLFSNILILSVGVATTSARSIGQYMPHLHIPSPFTPSTVSHSETSPSNSATSQSQCLFTPHQPLQKTQNPASIPAHAWPHIRTLLASHSNLINPPSKSSVQTLRLAEFTDDSSLESVVLGIVYTVPEQMASEKELRDVKKEGMKRVARLGGETKEMSREEKCLESAMEGVVAQRQMEGVLEIEGKGKVGFLVYRVD